MQVPAWFAALMTACAFSLGVILTAPAQAASPAPRWEYDFLSSAASSAEFQAKGAQGWEACAGTQSWVVFKRPIR